MDKNVFAGQLYHLSGLDTLVLPLVLLGLLFGANGALGITIKPPLRRIQQEYTISMVPIALVSKVEDTS